MVRMLFCLDISHMVKEETLGVDVGNNTKIMAIKFPLENQYSQH